MRTSPKGCPRSHATWWSACRPKTHEGSQVATRPGSSCRPSSFSHRHRAGPVVGAGRPFSGLVGTRRSCGLARPRRCRAGFEELDDVGHVGNQACGAGAEQVVGAGAGQGGDRSRHGPRLAGRGSPPRGRCGSTRTCWRPRQSRSRRRGRRGSDSWPASSSWTRGCRGCLGQLEPGGCDALVQLRKAGRIRAPEPGRQHRDRGAVVGQGGLVGGCVDPVCATGDDVNPPRTCRSWSVPSCSPSTTGPAPERHEANGSRCKRDDRHRMWGLESVRTTTSRGRLRVRH